MTDEELLAAACPPINRMGAAFMFAPPTVALGKSLGLDVFQFYGIGRGGLLGDVDPAVVHAAFGYFNPEFVRSLWSAAREHITPREAGLAYLDCAAEFGRARLAGLDLDAFCAAAGAVNDAADPVGLALYASVAAEPLVDDPPGRAGQLLHALRELRGSAHLAAIRAAGLSAKVAHCIKRPKEIAMFGWPDDGSIVITDQDRERLADAEAMTDTIVGPAYAVLDQAGRTALVDGLGAIKTALATAAS